MSDWCKGYIWDEKKKKPNGKCCESKNYSDDINFLAAKIEDVEERLISLTKKIK